MLSRPARYTTVAIGLHWAIALCIIALIAMGLWMKNAIADPQTQALAYRVFQLHKSLGFLVLALTVVRIVWRLTHPVPALPAGMRWWEKFAAGATHAAFYGLMLALPLTGWLYVSAGWAVATDRALFVPTSWFGLFTIPPLPFVADAAAATRRLLAFQSMGAHAALAWGAVALIVLHVSAALKHQFINRDGVLAQMLPGLPHSEAPRAAPPSRALHLLERTTGAGVILALAVAAAIAVQPAPHAISSAAPSVAPQAGLTQAPAATPPAAAAGSDAANGAQGAAAQAWQIERPESRISFAGEHSGAPFEGQFERWSGEVWFDPQNLAGSRADIRIDTASARTGDATQEGALEGEEWLNPKAFPTARFVASSFRALGGEHFEAIGALELKGLRLPVTLPFSFTESDGVARVTGETQFDRAALDVGMQSDADGAWVSKGINVRIAVTARRK